MYKFILCILSFILLSQTSCIIPNYKNKEIYHLKVGEELAIYAETNSCCYYRTCDKDVLSHMEFIDREVVKSSKRACAGCNYTEAFKFKANSSGKDTIHLYFYVAGGHCDSIPHRHEVYYVSID
ncbi:MAG: hypothetical protein AAGK97_09375 [Bacteroidota bacterium]